jgi:acyl-coenzyme A thioesterase PaaI-like protein
MVVTARVEAVTGDKDTLVALLQGTMLPLRP